MDDSKLLGPVIKAWFKRWDWPQSVTEGVARAKGWENGPWASQISICMAGRLTPKPAFFMALGEFNRVVAERDFKEISDRRLVDRLRNGQPLTHDNGVPWTGIDFFSCFVGELQAPSDGLKGITQADVDHWTAEVRSCFREYVLSSMEPPAQAWRSIAERAKDLGAAPEDIVSTQEVVSGLRETSIEEATRLALKYPNNPIIQAMLQAQESVGGDTSRLKKLLAYRRGLKPSGYPLPVGISNTGKVFGFDPSRSAIRMVAMR